MLVVSWHFRAASMGEFSREEFISGMQVCSAAVSCSLCPHVLGAQRVLPASQSLNCFSVAALRDKLPELRAEVADPLKFRVRTHSCCRTGCTGVSGFAHGCMPHSVHMHVQPTLRSASSACWPGTATP